MRTGSLHLLVTTAVLLPVAYLIARRFLSPGLALAAAVGRFALPVLYFTLWYDGTWTILDDVVYADGAAYLLGRGFSPWTLLSTTDGRVLLFAVAGGEHIVYNWYNVLAQWLFGTSYASAVLLNVLLTFSAAAGMARLVRLAGVEGRYPSWCALFFLFHPELVMWSSFINLKDVLILTLTVWSAVWFVSLPGSTGPARVRRTIGLAMAMLVFVFIRFYLPVLLVASASAWLVLGGSRRARWSLAIVGLLAAAAYFLFRDRVPTDMLAPGGALQGAFIFLLTPRPWGLQREYTFLFLPAIVHWLLFVSLPVGAWLLWRRYAVARLVLLYLAVLTAFYAVVPELLSSRQRFQALFVFSWIQFHVLWLALRASGVTIRTSIPAAPHDGLQAFS